MKKINLLLTVFLMIVVYAQSQTFSKISGRAKPVSQVSKVILNQPSAPLTAGFADGFESYPDFNLTFPPWTLVDVDGAPTWGISGVTFPNQYEPMAFIVFNPSATEPPMTSGSIQPHSGNKFAACFASNGAVNNDWLISQQVVLGTSSSVSFWVKSYTAQYGLERYKVGVSTTNTVPASFTIISGTNYLTAPSTAWELKTFDLNAYNGQSVYIGIQCISDDAFLFMVDDFEVITTSGQTSTLTGKVTDAFNGNPIEGAFVEIAGLNTTTDINGDYTIYNVPPGTLNANFSASTTQGEAPLVVSFFDQSSENAQTVTCSKTGYITYVNHQVVIDPGQTLNLNISLSPTLAPGSMRFVLNWGADPPDLDSHLNTPVIEGQAYHIYYQNQGSATSAPYAALDHDVTQGYGPETMTIYQKFSGTYQYYIYDFTGGATPITASQAVVQIYDENGLMQTLQVPGTGSGRYWYVCDMNGDNGQITIRNVIQESAPGSFRDAMPPKETNPCLFKGKNITSWLWDFGDGATSAQQNPSHTYASAGTFNVSLTISDGTNSDTELKNSYIAVTGSGGTGTLNGLVTDALNGNPIPGALVSVAGLSAYTDDNGNYTITNIPAGALKAAFSANNTSGEAPLAVSFFDQSTENAHTVTCSKIDYSTYSNSQVIIPQGGTLTLNISLSPALTPGSIRFVLNWGADPPDLDSHLNTPVIEGQAYHIYYQNQGSATTAPYAALDHDVTQGYGPETMTIYQKFSGTYQYYIYDFTGGAIPITASQAVVQIYDENGLMQTLQVPGTGSGRYWYVCDMNGDNGQITIRNVIQESAPGSFRDAMPPKETNHGLFDSKNITSWLWNFGDGATSAQQNPSHTYTSAGTFDVSLTISDGTNSNTEVKNDYISVTGSGGTGTLSGLVTDALNGNPIPGALVTVAGLSATTDDNGNYTIANIPAGVLKAAFSANHTSGEAPLAVNFFDQSTENSNTVTCSKANYSTYSNNQVIIPQGGTLTLNISLSPALTPGSIRFVLNWGADPPDLDSHLNTPVIEGQAYHIYYESQGNATSAPYAALDHDVTHGFGPETMTIYQEFSGTYQYYIFDYTGGSTPITASQAVVQIYDETGLLHTLQVPGTGSGRYWYVCDMNGSNEQITIRNVIQESAPGSFRDVMPAKKAAPGMLNSKNMTSWLWNFGDGTTSTQQNPSHTYATGGIFDVSLTVGDGVTQSTETKPDFIQVGYPGIGEASLARQINIYPVPVEGELWIDSPEKMHSISITDISGREMYQITSQVTNLKINTGKLKSGAYFLLIETSSGKAVKMFTVK